MLPLQESYAPRSPFAVTAESSRGREVPEEPHPFKGPFQIDLERIVRSKAFRRLMHKTQVFLAPRGDHFLTRLTHTMEVSLTARAVAGALGLNLQLTEAICMGHDLGHSPFGHLGETTLAEVHRGGFRHNRQSVRVVELLENDGRGLNVNWEVRQGILRHSKSRKGIEGTPNPELDTLEAQTAKIADALAYVSHDADDAIRAGIISEDDLPRPVVAALGTDRSRWSEVFVAGIVESSRDILGDGPSERDQSPAVRMGNVVSEAANALRDFLFERVYEPASLGEQAERARAVIRLLYRYFAEHPDRVPPDYSVRGEEPHQVALDYVSGMTDSYALRVADAIEPGVTHGFAEQGVSLSMPISPETAADGR
jgi:dGTPase